MLLLTPHLGNWELGGALLARRGIKMVVLTQAEPGDGLTELRQDFARPLGHRDVRDRQQRL